MTISYVGLLKFLLISRDAGAGAGAAVNIERTHCLDTGISAGLSRINGVRRSSAKT